MDEATVTGDCAHIALRLALALEIEGARAVRVVHGRPIGTGGNAQGLRYFHAWVEMVEDGRTLAIDFSNGLRVMLPRSRYYRLGRIRDVRRYTVEDAIDHVDRTGHAGPWDPALDRDMEAVDV